MDLIKSGSYIDILFAKTCATTKISTVVGYHVVLAVLLFRLCYQYLSIDLLSGQAVSTKGFLNVNDTLLQSTLYNHHSIVSVFLKYC